MARSLCPTCSSPMEYKPENPFRPFCSERCKNKDFINWANEEHHIPGSTEYDDLLSGELGPANGNDSQG